MEALTQDLPQYIAYGLAVVGFASVALQALAKVTKITPGTRDDELVAKSQKAIKVAAVVLDRLSVALPADKSRPSR